MKNLRANLRFWIAGAAVAFSGVVLARGLAPHLDGASRIAFTVGGQLLALGGLYIICLGIRRRIQHVRSAGAPPETHAS